MAADIHRLCRLTAAGVTATDEAMRGAQAEIVDGLLDAVAEAGLEVWEPAAAAPAPAGKSAATVVGAELVSGRRLLALVNQSGVPEMVIGAYPTPTPGLYVHEQISPSMSGLWQVSNGFGAKVRDGFGSLAMARAAAVSLAGLVPDWETTDPRELPHDDTIRAIGAALDSVSAP